MSRCVCCDLPEESCGRAIEERARKDAANERSQALARPGWFGAQFGGVCPTCGEGYGPGTPLHKTWDGWSCCGE